MVISDFKTMVAAFLNRDAASLTRGSVDLLLLAANRAKLWAQREYDFELARRQLTLVVNQTTGGNLDSLTPIPKKVEQITLPSGVQIDFVDRLTQSRRYQRLVNGRDLATEAARLAAVNLDQPITAYQQGRTLFIYPINTPGVFTSSNISVVLDVVQWMPDYDAVTITSDFFIVYCTDWMLYRTVFELNIYLKDDERVAIDVNAMKLCWDAVIKWDRSLIPQDSLPVPQAPRKTQFPDS